MVLNFNKPLLLINLCVKIKSKNLDFCNLFNPWKSKYRTKNNLNNDWFRKRQEMFLKYQLNKYLNSRNNSNLKIRQWIECFRSSLINNRHSVNWTSWLIKMNRKYLRLNRMNNSLDYNNLYQLRTKILLINYKSK